MLVDVASGAKGNQVSQRVVALLAPANLVVDLKILERAASLTPPPVPLQHSLHQAPVDSLPQEPAQLPECPVVAVKAGPHMAARELRRIED